MNESTYDILVNEYGMSPAQIEELMRLGSLGAEQGMLERQLAQADALRQTQAPSGRYAGRIYKAPHIFEQLGAVAQRASGDMQAAKVQDEMRRVADEQARLRMALLMAGRREGAPAAAAPPVAPASGGGATTFGLGPAQLRGIPRRPL